MERFTEVITRGAVMVCDQGSKTIRLDIPKCSAHIDWKPLACMLDCIGETNIKTFGYCNSPKFKGSKMKVGGSKSEMVAAARANTKIAKECLLNYLEEKWYNTNERVKISSAYEMQMILSAALIDYQETLNEVLNIFKGGSMSYVLDPIITNDIRRLSKVNNTLGNTINVMNSSEWDIEDVTNSIERVNIEISESLAIVKELGDGRITVATGEFFGEAYYKEKYEPQLKTCSKKLAENKNDFDGMVDLYKLTLEEAKEKLAEAIDFKLEINDILTLDSVLLCRHGGVIYFITSGQEYMELYGCIEENYDDPQLQLLQQITKLAVEYAPTDIDKANSLVYNFIINGEFKANVGAGVSKTDADKLNYKLKKLPVIENHFNEMFIDKNGNTLDIGKIASNVENYMFIKGDENNVIADKEEYFSNKLKYLLDE